MTLCCGDHPPPRRWERGLIGSRPQTNLPESWFGPDQRLPYTKPGCRNLRASRKGGGPPHQVAQRPGWRSLVGRGPAPFSHKVGRAGLPYQRTSPAPRVLGIGAKPPRIRMRKIGIMVQAPSNLPESWLGLANRTLRTWVPQYASSQDKGATPYNALKVAAALQEC